MKLRLRPRKNNRNRRNGNGGRERTRGQSAAMRQPLQHNGALAAEEIEEYLRRGK